MLIYSNCSKKTVPCSLGTEAGGDSVGNSGAGAMVTPLPCIDSKQ